MKFCSEEGARGPGKTECGIVWLLGDELELGELYINHPRYRALVLRKNAKDLSDWLDRATYMYSSLGAKTIRGTSPEIRFPSGAVFRTGHLKDKSSYEQYQGHEYPRILIEELTQIPEEKYYVQILGSCRSTIAELRPQVFCTTNPGGVGHYWVKERFVDSSTPGIPYTYELTVNDVKHSRSRVFIPALIEDNPTLLEKDPEYVLYLESIKETDPDLYEAWRFGSWNVFAGQFFKGFRLGFHTCKPFTPKTKLAKVGGIDWGITAPFVFLGSAIQKVVMKDGRKFNRVWTYKEIDGTDQIPTYWAQQIKSRVNLDQYDAVRADPAMFHRSPDGSTSIADQMKLEWGKNAWKLKPANNDRIGGWAITKNWLSTAPDGLPYWLISEQCKNLIKTLPALVHDENKVEDVDCFVAGTLITTLNGNVAIENIEDGDLVLTPVGFRLARFTGPPQMTLTVRIKLSNGKELTGTWYHKVMVRGKGLVRLRDLRCNDILEVWNTSHLVNTNPLFTAVLSIGDIRDAITTNLTEHIHRKGTIRCIGKYGLILMVGLLRVFTFTIEIMIMIIMTLKTWRLFLRESMQNYTTLTECSPANYRRRTGSGERAKRGKFNYARTLIKCVIEPLQGNYRALIVEKVLQRNTKHRDTATSTRNPLGFLSVVVQYVAKLCRLNYPEIKQQSPVHITAVGHSEIGEVYRLRVGQAHLYYANGVLVTNTDGPDHHCDSARYKLSHVKWTDARVGGVGGTPSTRKYPKALIQKDGGIQSIDVDRFAVDAPSSRSNRKAV